MARLNFKIMAMILDNGIRLRSSPENNRTFAIKRISIVSGRVIRARHKKSPVRISFLFSVQDEKKNV